MHRVLLRSLQNRKGCVLFCCVTILIHACLILYTRKPEYSKEIKPRRYESNVDFRIFPTKTLKTNASGVIKKESSYESAGVEGSRKHQFTCKEITEFRRQATVVREANEHGNKVIYKVDLFNESLILKEAIIYNETDATDRFRYTAALKEIRSLEELNKIEFKNYAALRGKCVTSSRILFAVDLARDSNPICNGNGTDLRCLMLQDVKEAILSSQDPTLSSAMWLKKATCFFKQFSDHFIFMEDMSGANLFYSPHTWDITLVDADSLIFYSNVSILSRMACREDNDCPKPSGSLWPWHSLNRKIYGKCHEVRGRCVNNVCSGYNANLHSCGIGYWLLTILMRTFPPIYYREAREIRHCLMAPYPDDRCSMANACEKATDMLKSIELNYHN